MIFLLLLLFCRATHSQDLHEVLASSPPIDTHPRNALIKPLSYDLQLQLPLSEVADPDTPLFTARVTIQFDLTKEINTIGILARDETVPAASLHFSILGLDHFENVSLVYNGVELDVANVILTDNQMQIVMNQPVLFAGRYILSVQRYKGFVGNAIYYRDAGDQAVFGSNFYPHRVSAVMPVVDPVTNKVPISLTVVHPHSTRVLSSAPEEGIPTDLDENWQVTAFRPTVHISPGVLALALLPEEYEKTFNTYTGILLTLHYNKYRMTEIQAQKILDLGTQVLGLLRSFFSSAVAMAKLDLVVINDIVQTNSYGTIIFPEDSFMGADVANQIHSLAGEMSRQWIGGLVNVEDERELCIQEDLAEYIALKIVKRMTNDESLRLAHNAKILLNEDFFEPGQNLEINGDSERKISAVCGLKGVIYLESLENVLGEKEMLQRINTLIFTSKNEHFSLNSFMSLISTKVDDGLVLSQVYNFWYRSRGIPHLFVRRVKDALQLTQVINNRTVYTDYKRKDAENITLWPLNLEFSDFKLPMHFMVSQGIHLAPVRESLSLANLGFKHFYRVNYDIHTWRQVKDALYYNTTLYSMRERLHLVSDFCHFYQKGDIVDPLADQLRNEILQMVRLKSDHFQLCELFVWGCGAGPQTREIPREVLIKLRKQLEDSLRNENDFSCGRGTVHTVANLLCREATGKACL